MSHISLEGIDLLKAAAYDRPHHISFAEPVKDWSKMTWYFHVVHMHSRHATSRERANDTALNLLSHCSSASIATAIDPSPLLMFFSYSNQSIAIAASIATTIDPLPSLVFAPTIAVTVASARRK